MACPFYRFDPNRHARCGTNILAGYFAVKQHIGRKHRLAKNYCPICWTNFKDQPAWSAHLANSRDDDDAACERAPTPEDLYDCEWKKLNDVPKKYKDEAKWLWMWQTLFPGHSLQGSVWYAGEMEELVDRCRPLIWGSFEPRIPDLMMRHRLSEETLKGVVKDLLSWAPDPAATPQRLRREHAEPIVGALQQHEESDPQTFQNSTDSGGDEPFAESQTHSASHASTSQATGSIQPNNHTQIQGTIQTGRNASPFCESELQLGNTLSFESVASSAYPYQQETWMDMMSFAAGSVFDPGTIRNDGVAVGTMFSSVTGRPELPLINVSQSAADPRGQAAAAFEGCFYLANDEDLEAAAGITPQTRSGSPVG